MHEEIEEIMEEEDIALSDLADALAWDITSNAHSYFAQSAVRKAVKVKWDMHVGKEIVVSDLAAMSTKGTIDNNSTFISHIPSKFRKYMEKNREEALAELFKVFSTKQAYRIVTDFLPRGFEVVSDSYSVKDEWLSIKYERRENAKE